jgi:peptide/nickel transport system permease protein
MPESTAIPAMTRRPAEPTLAVMPPRSRSRWGARVQLAVALAVAIILVLFAVAPGLVAGKDPTTIALGATLRPPSAEHWFGTDQLGRDLFSRVVHGARISLFVALCAVTLAGVIGALVGVTAGYLGGLFDAVAMRVVDIQLALPAVILALVLVGAVGTSMFNLIVVLSLANWARFARVTRAEALSLRTRDFVLLSRLAGASRVRIILSHVVPNVVNTFIVLATLDVGIVIILEATLSFLGLGVPPPAPAWGSMIADGRQYLETAWWICGIPGLVLMATVLAANLLGDALRDWLSPTASRNW